MKTRFNENEVMIYDYAYIKKYTENNYKLTYLKFGKVKEGFEKESKRTRNKEIKNDIKLNHNINRAKAKVREYGLCNGWDYFITLTLDKSKYDRYDLEKYHKDLKVWINNYNRLQNVKLKYLLIPEKHKDGAWHIHGLIKDIPPNDIKLNNNGYLTWIKYSQKFGYASMSKIKSIEKTANYITKYIKKAFGKDRNEEVGKHLYYSSRGLKQAEIIKEGTIPRNIVQEIKGFETEYAITKWTTDSKELEILFN